MFVSEEQNKNVLFLSSFKYLASLCEIGKDNSTDVKEHYLPRNL